MGPPGALWPIPLETHTRPNSVLAIQTPQVRAHGAVLGAPTTRLTGRGEVERFTGRDGLGLDDAGIGIADLGKRMLFEAASECGAGISVAGHARCCCERVCQSPD